MCQVEFQFDFFVIMVKQRFLDGFELLSCIPDVHQNDMALNHVVLLRVVTYPAHAMILAWHGRWQ